MFERIVAIPERNARSALEAFIKRARYDCAAFGSDLVFDEPVWDVTKSCPRPRVRTR